MANPTIARIWRGRVTRAKAAAYARYNYEVGIKPLEEKALGVQSLREDRDGESEFITISYWESGAAMARFTGGDPTAVEALLLCMLQNGGDESGEAAVEVAAAE